MCEECKVTSFDLQWLWITLQVQSLQKPYSGSRDWVQTLFAAYLCVQGLSLTHFSTINSDINPHLLPQSINRYPLIIAHVDELQAPWGFIILLLGNEINRRIWLSIGYTISFKMAGWGLVLQYTPGKEINHDGWQYSYMGIRKRKILKQGPFEAHKEIWLGRTKLLWTPHQRSSSILVL